jgi:hypothetical protein
MAEVVRLETGEPGARVRHKIAFRHRDLRALEEETGETVLGLLNKPFYGWAMLLLAGRRQYDPNVTKDKVSDLIDEWLKDEKNEYDQLGPLLTQAIRNAKYVKFAESTDKADEAPAEGNAQTQTTDL